MLAGDAMTKFAISACSHKVSRLSAAVLASAMFCALAATSAQAGGIFDFLFGGGKNRTSSPFAFFDPRADGLSRDEPTNEPFTSGGRAFCVRLCDGRYYPITSGAANSTPVQMCSAMCPAAKTKIFHGGDIETAADSGGMRYSRLEQAFAYRKTTVPGCTCNGKDPYGLVQIDIKSDPTLRGGDMIATGNGFKTYNESRTADSQRGRFSDSR